MKVPIVGALIDERFLMHRLRSTSIAGIAGCTVAMAIFAWRCYANHVWSWDLLAVGITMVAVKWALLLWYRFKD